MNSIQAIQMAARLANQGKLVKAQKICQDIIASNEKFHPAYHLLGQLAFQDGRLDIAAQLLKNASYLDPKRASYYRDLAEVLFHSNKLKDTLLFLRRALDINSEDPKTHFLSGLTLMKNGEGELAIKSFETVINLAPNFGAAYNNIGSLLENSGRLDEAIKNYKEAIRIDANNIQAQNNLASTMIATGDMERAKKHLFLAIKTDPSYIEAHHNLSGLKKYKKSDQDLKNLKKIAKDFIKLSPINQVRLHFILAKAHSDIGEHDRAFFYYQLANTKMRSNLEYNQKVAEKVNIDLINVFNIDYFGSDQILDNEDPTPIFIVGMPRSGSTLVEQIVASHSEVYAAGELTLLGDIIKSKIDKFPVDLETLNKDELKNIGKDYLAEIKKIAPNAKRIVDKMPGNYQFIGIISKILPGARIIHTKRNPIDCCFSIYTRLFLEKVHYAYDLGELGNYYKLYEDLMDHWRDLLSDGIMIEVNYEGVVGDLEGEARKILDFIDLEWEGSVLGFHKQAGVIKTASAAQVRKPIYQTSIQRWRVYEKHLRPLIELLEQK